GRHGCEAFDDSGTRLTPYEVPLRVMCHVHRCGPGDRNDRGAGVMAAYERVLVEIAGGIGTVTLNRPEKLNALDRALCDELREALALLTQSDAVRVIVITGAGRAFCAGADLGVLDRDGSALVAAGKDVALALRAAPQPVPPAGNGLARRPARSAGPRKRCIAARRARSPPCSISRSLSRTSCSPVPRRASASRGLYPPRGATDGPQAEQLRRMDRLFPLLAGFDRPAPGRDPQIQVRGEVRGAGSASYRIRPLQRPAQMADRDAHPRPADSRRPLEPDRVPGRHGVRLGGAAAQPAHARPVGLRSARADAGDDRGNAPRLADVVSPL